MNPTLDITEESVISAQLQYRDNFYKFGRHVHNSFEIYHFLSGCCAMDVENKVLHCREGDFVLIMPNVIHSFFLEQKDACTFHHIHFATGLFEKLLLHSQDCAESSILSALIFKNNACYKTAADAKLAALTASVIEQFARKTPLSRALSNLSLTALLLHVLEMSGYSNPLNGQSNAQKEYVRFAVDYIRDNYASKMLVSDIAQRLNISSRYLSKIFREQMNMTVLEYINTYRINQSIRLMQDTKLSLTEIADRIGLKDSQHFSHLFYNTIGMTPYKYRKLVTKE